LSGGVVQILVEGTFRELTVATLLEVCWRFMPFKSTTGSPTVLLAEPFGWRK
jgi:hypothetical protein